MWLLTYNDSSYPERGELLVKHANQLKLKFGYISTHTNHCAKNTRAVHRVLVNGLYVSERMLPKGCSPSRGSKPTERVCLPVGPCRVPLLPLRPLTKGGEECWARIAIGHGVCGGRPRCPGGGRKGNLPLGSFAFCIGGTKKLLQFFKPPHHSLPL